MKRVAAALMLLSVLLTGACSVVPTREMPDRDPGKLWAERKQQLDSLETWDFSGRVAVSGRDIPSRTMRVRWSQNDDGFDLAFMTLLGQRVAELEGRPGEVVLRMPGEEPVVAADSRELLDAVLGWSAPVESLRYWVLGLSHPQAKEPDMADLDGRGRLVQLQEGEWHVGFDRYAGRRALDLPERLTVTHPGLRIRLIIDRWGV